MIRLVIFLFCLCIIECVSAQVINTTSMDTTEITMIGHVGLGGYVDSYYGYNFNKPENSTNQYFVSSARDNEISVNLAYVDVRYRSTYMRARFVPGFGTYMDANYKNEPGSLKNMLEANVGVLVFPKKNIWIDAGVIGSPYTNESAISKDHLMYTRSFAPENVPYYLSGVKVSIPLSKRVNAYLYIINGWQVIQDNNRGKSIGTQLEYRPNESMLFNWNTYTGDERSTENPDYRVRFFNDFYWIYKPKGRFSATSCFYFGYQQKSNAPTVSWWQVNFIGSYKLNEIVSISGRIEHFDDSGGALYPTVNPGTGLPGFRSSSTGLCANFKLHKLALFRVEAREFFSPDKVYEDVNQNPTHQNFLLMANLTAWF